MFKPSALVVALLGAESTGKSTLAQALADMLLAEGRDAVVVPEYLRAFCLDAGRTPLPHEQHQIAATQSRLIAQAARAHAIVVADTSALMTAVYSECIFGDASLYPQAIAAHRRFCRLTLVTALDLPWQAGEGGMRDGPGAQSPVDARLRAALGDADIPFSVVYGSGSARVHAAMAAVRIVLARPHDAMEAPPRWRHVCARCGDPACEALLMPRP